MKILYVTAFPNEYFKKAISQNNKVSGLAAQKFNSTFINGFVKNKNDISILCPRDIMAEEIEKKTRFKWQTIIENDIQYLFPPTSPNKYLRKILRTFSLKRYLIHFYKQNPDGIVIMDVLSPCADIIHSVAKNKCYIATDLSNNPEEHQKHASMYKMLSEADYLVLLSNQMREVIDMQNVKDSIVIQGVADVQTESEINKKRIILFSGTLNESNGISNLIEAFSRLNTNYELHFYGTGSSVKTIQNCNIKNVKYMGTVSNDIMVKKQKEALILVNPRPMNQDFVAFSFPSKLIEYLASGTATISTKLSCITSDYDDYLLYFKDDTVNGLYDSLNQLVNLPERELIDIGKKQQNFVLENKSNIIQAKKVLDMVSKNLI